MIEVTYRPSFIRQIKVLEKSLFEEVLDSVELFKSEKNHASLKVHKLHGSLSGRYSFSVNYRFRIIFRYVSKKEAVLLAFGDHDLYR